VIHRPTNRLKPDRAQLLQAPEKGSQVQIDTRTYRRPTVQKETIRPIESAPTTIPPQAQNPTLITPPQRIPLIYASRDTKGQFSTADQPNPHIFGTVGGNRSTRRETPRRHSYLARLSLTTVVTVSYRLQGFIRIQRGESKARVPYLHPNKGPFYKEARHRIPMLPVTREGREGAANGLASLALMAKMQTEMRVKEHRGRPHHEPHTCHISEQGISTGNASINPVTSSRVKRHHKPRNWVV